jgi:hypothetical protein
MVPQKPEAIKHWFMSKLIWEKIRRWAATKTAAVKAGIIGQ